ncbi:MAG: PPC domain-containing protein, partial [Planctomycetia bacterium]|nr:PPC domain-containing protein [Planctomycetia bacterium]
MNRATGARRGKVATPGLTMGADVGIGLPTWLKRWRTWSVPSVPPRRQLRAGPSLGMEALEARILPTAAIQPNAVVLDRIAAAGEADVRQLTLTEAGLLVITSAGTAGLDTRLTLSGPNGQLLVQSDGQAPNNATDLIRQHLPAGTYFITVQGLG